MPFHNTTLPNGLRVIGETSPSARSVALGFFVRAGARDETPEVSGVSHFLEHMVFKGTERRTALDVNLDFDRIGADYNAYTSEENTVYHAAVLPEYLPRAVDVLADILRPSLRGDDFDTEKKVIIEEIGMYEDMPNFLAYDHARTIHYGRHPLANSVLGTKASIEALSRDQMQAYFDRRYAAPNIVVAAAGHFEFDRFVDEVARRCADWPTVAVGRESLVEAAAAGGTHVVSKEGVAQEHLVLASTGPASTSPLRYAADLLAVALGDESGSRLYWALVDPGHADSADMGFHEYDATGTFYASITCEPERTAANLEIARGVLRAAQQDGISPDELRQAKNKIASRLVRAAERPKGRMQAIATAWVYQGEYRDLDAEMAGFGGVELKDVREVLDRYPIDKPTAVAFGPLTSL